MAGIIAMLARAKTGKSPSLSGSGNVELT